MSLSKQLVFSGSTISVDGTSVGATYNIPLGNPALFITEIVGFFTISGTASLSSSLTITSSYTPSAPVRLTFLSRCNMTLNGNTITIFGQSLTAYQAANPFVLDAWWDGVIWQASIGQIEVKPTGLPNSQLANMPAETFKMNSGILAGPPQDVTYANTRKVLNTEYDLINCLVDFNSGYLNRQDILIPYKGEVTKMFAYITQDIDSVADKVIDIGIAGSAGGGYSAIDTFIFPASSSANTFQEIDPTTINTFNANNYVVFDPQTITWGGRVIFTIVTKRT